MTRTNFEKLEVYQLAERVADEIWNIVKGWGSFEKYAIGAQMIRAADSIGANIAEGVGRGSFNDNKRFIRMARGSLNETKHWLRRSYTRELLTKEQIKVLKPLIDELSPRLNAYLKSIGKSKKLNNQQRTKYTL